MEKGVLVIVDLGFAFFQFWFWFFFPKEDCKRPLFMGNCSVISSISMSLSLSFLNRQGEEKRGELVEENSSSLNRICI